MAKSKLRWDGTAEDGRTTSVQWNDNPFTWGDVFLAEEVADAISGGSYKRRKENLDKLLQDKDKKKKLIHLICRIKGKKVYDDVTEVGDIDVKVEDAELVVETIVKKVKLEIKENV